MRSSQLLLLFVAITIIYYVRTSHGLEIEHPHSFSSFKRGVMLGDVSYSYSSTDMGSPESGHYKTVTVIKNIAVPKPTSTMFSDRSEHFYDSIEKVSSGASLPHKKRTHVEYWPPRDENHVAHRLKLEQEVKKASNTVRPKNRNYHHHRYRQETTSATTPRTFVKPAEINEQPQEDPKHPIDLLELAKSAVKTLNQKAKTVGENTGPVTFPSDANAMKKKKQNGIVSVAKEFTSIVTTDPKDRQPIVSKLHTKIDPPTKAPALPYTSTTSEEIPLQDFEQSEFVFNHKTGTFEFRKASKAPKAVQEYLRASPYGYREEPKEEHSDSNTYSSPSELLFAELHKAVTTRNVSMIKSLAGQLEETFNIGKLDFESLKTETDLGRRTTEEPMPETTTGRSMFDFGYGNGYGETTTMDYQEPMTEPIVTTTTIKAPIMMAPTTKKPLRYIAPKLRGFKRFSSKRQSN
uniref:Uncharacterized protein n=1 Tax=Anopheles farauti TaxID=69004 RepID=A0A182QTA1_9DIPT